MGFLEEVLGRDRATRNNRLVTGGILLASAAAIYYFLNPKDSRKQVREAKERMAATADAAAREVRGSDSGRRG